MNITHEIKYVQDPNDPFFQFHQNFNLKSIQNNQINPFIYLNNFSNLIKKFQSNDPTSSLSIQMKNNSRAITTIKGSIIPKEVSRSTERGEGCPANTFDLKPGK